MQIRRLLSNAFSAERASPLEARSRKDRASSSNVALAEAKPRSDVRQRSINDTLDLVIAQRLDRVDTSAREQRRVYLERRVLSRGSNQDERSRFDVRQKTRPAVTSRSGGFHR